MLRCLAASLVALAAAIGPVSASERPAEVMHFWVSGSEHAALDVIKTEFTRRGGQWLDNPQKNNVDLRRVMQDRLATGTAPTALQWQGGAELRDMVEIGLIDDFDALAQRNHWDQVLPQPVKDRITYDGHYFLAPTGVHSENWIFYNRKALERAGIAPPSSMADLRASFAKLEAVGVTPIALGRSEWEARVMFISALMSTMGSDAFGRLIEKRDTSVLERPEAARAIDLYFAMAHHLGPADARPAEWTDATAAVGAGRSAFLFQGDWAKGELSKLGYKLGDDFGCMLVPGTENLLSVVVDTFAFPRSLATSDTAGRDKLIESMLDPTVQARFNLIKGSVPVRIDVPDTSLDACAVKAETLLRTPNAVMTSPAQTMSTALVSDLHALAARVINDPDFTQVQALDTLKSIFHASLAEAP